MYNVLLWLAYIFTLKQLDSVVILLLVFALVFQLVSVWCLVCPSVFKLGEMQLVWWVCFVDITGVYSVVILLTDRWIFGFYCCLYSSAAVLWGSTAVCTPGVCHHQQEVGSLDPSPRPHHHHHRLRHHLHLPHLRIRRRCLLRSPRRWRTEQPLE